jgi:hydrogenase small subunit
MDEFISAAKEVSIMEGTVQQMVRGQGVTRREFLKFCSMMTGVLALPRSYAARIESALAVPTRLPVVWLEFQDCAGNSEALLRASRPTVSELVLDVLSVDYHETIMAAAGKQSEEARDAAIEAGGYLLVVEGSIPTADDGVYCTIGGRTAMDILQSAAANAVAIVAAGACAAFGGPPLHLQSHR